MHSNSSDLMGVTMTRTWNQPVVAACGSIPSVISVFLGLFHTFQWSSVAGPHRRTIASACRHRCAWRKAKRVLMAGPLRICRAGTQKHWQSAWLPPDPRRLICCWPAAQWTVKTRQPMMRSVKASVRLGSSHTDSVLICTGWCRLTRSAALDMCRWILTPSVCPF